VGYSLPAPPYRMPGLPGADGALDRARAALNAAGAGIAVLEPGIAPALSGLANVVLAAELARAANDWLVEEWLDADERFRGSIVVASRDGVEAAAEVRRVAGDPRLAQIVLAFPPALLGDRSLYPLFEAAQEADLPVSLQAGGAYIGSNAGPTPAGFPTTLAEYRIDNSYGGIAHLVSVVLEGVFDRFPALRIVLSGFGIGWLPSVLWRLDRLYAEGSAGPAPKLGRPPEELVRDHVRFTTRDLEAPSVAELLRVLPVEDVARLLLHSSGYPQGGGSALAADLPEPARDAVLYGNASSWFRLAGVAVAGNAT
jgi:predicted TIM-barrel fold metal-dependent hydrolase